MRSARRDGRQVISGEVIMSVDAIAACAEAVLAARGMAGDQASAVASFIAAAERDDCPSHGIYRLLGMLRSIDSGKVGLAGRPEVTEPRPGIVAVDAHRGFSPLSYRVGRPLLEARARENGLGALVPESMITRSLFWYVCARKHSIARRANSGRFAVSMTAQTSGLMLHRRLAEKPATIRCRTNGTAPSPGQP